MAPAQGILSGGTDVSVTGERFTDYAGFKIVLAGVPCNRTTVLSSTSAVCVLPAGSNATTGNVTSSFGASGASTPYSYTPPTPPTWTYFSVPTATGAKPVITQVSPSSGPASGGTLVTLSGLNLGVNGADLTELLLGGASCVLSRVWVSSSRVMCTSAAVSAAVSRAPVLATTASGGTGPVSAVFTYTYPPPVLLYANPRVVKAEGGSRVTLRGSYLGATNASSGAGGNASLAVSVGGVRCPLVAWNSETEIVCVTPPQSAMSQPNSTDLPLVAVVAGVASAPLSAGFRYGAECVPTCDWNRACLPSGTCSAACLAGWANPPACTTPLFELVVPSGNLTTNEDGDMLVALAVRMNGASGSVPAKVSFNVAIDNPGEGAWRPKGTEFAIAAGTPLPALAEIVLFGVADGARDGARRWSATISQPDGSLASTYGAPPALAPVRLVNLDTRPRVYDVSPNIVAQIGGKNITVTGAEWDEVPVIRVGNVLVNRSRITLGYASASARLTARSSAGSRGALQAAGSLVRTAVFEAPPQAAPGYYDVTVQNGDGLNAAGSAYYSDDCPTEGQFGRGLECKPCPTGAYCPGGYRIWPLAGYWSPSEDSGFVIACDPAESCLGGQVAPGTAPSVQCAPHYTGERCGECVTGFARIGGFCAECPKKQTISGYIFADCVVWCFFALCCAFVVPRTRLQKVVLGISILQGIAGLGEALTGPSIPMWVLKVYKFLHLFSGDFEFLRPDCGSGAVPWSRHYFASYFYTLSLFVPAVALVAAKYVVARAQERKLQRGGAPAPNPIPPGRLVLAAHAAADPEALAEAMGKLERAVVPTYSSYFYKLRLKRVLLLSIQLLYIPLSAISVETVACIRSSDGSNPFMVTRPWERCWTKGKVPAVILSILTIIFLSIGLPVFQFVTLRRSDAESLTYNVPLMMVWDGVYRSYQPRYRFLWLVEFPISFVIACIKSILRPVRNKAALPVTCVAFAIKLVIAIVIRPFVLLQRNVFYAMNAAFLLIATNLNFYAARVLNEHTTGFAAFFGVMLICALMGAIALMLSVLLPGSRGPPPDIDAGDDDLEKGTGRRRGKDAQDDAATSTSSEPVDLNSSNHNDNAPRRPDRYTQQRGAIAPGAELGSGSSEGGSSGGGSSGSSSSGASPKLVTLADSTADTPPLVRRGASKKRPLFKKGSESPASPPSATKSSDMSSASSASSSSEASSSSVVSFKTSSPSTEGASEEDVSQSDESNDLFSPTHAKKKVDDNELF